MQHKRKRYSGGFTFRERSSHDDGAKPGETPARLRFQNQKPLCLQYNLGSNGYHKRMQGRYKKTHHKRSLVETISPFLYILYQWFISIHYKLVDFILEPVENLFDGDKQNCAAESFNHVNLNAKALSTLRSLSRTNSIKQKMAIRCMNRKRDYGRSVRMSMYQERMSELCIAS